MILVLIESYGAKLSNETKIIKFGPLLAEIQLKMYNGPKI